MKNQLRILLAGLLLVGSAGAQVAEDDLLRPEDAFKLNASTRADVLRLEWTIAEGYYLYRSKFGFKTKTPGVVLEDPVIPPGKMKDDEFFGQVEIFRNEVAIDLPLSVQAGRPAAIELEAISQGCADIGVCYPPYTHKVRLDVPPALVATGVQAVQPGGETPQPANALKALTDFAQSLGGSTTQEEFLDPDVAFVLDVEVDDHQTVIARWQIADGYYLYRDKFKFTVQTPDAIKLGLFEMPRGKVKEDEFFGTVEVFYHDAAATVPLRRETLAATQLRLDVGYQGCADAGLCYPPITKTVSLNLPGIGPDGGVDQTPVASSDPALASPESTTAGSATPEPGFMSEQDRIARSLAGGNTWLMMLTFFGFGLLLTFTPCVLPMIPILSSIIVGQGEEATPRRAFALSLTYVLAMAATYTVVGIIAGLFGHNLQATFQNPWVLSIFSGIFVLLSLSMFGFYELQVPTSWQAKLTGISNRQESGTFIGAGVMGFLSALIVGPCVAAPLAGALIYIGQTGDAALGGMALFSLSMGMGAPLLAIGTSAGKLLPRAGAWMKAVKGVFGVVLLGVAIYLIERIVPGWIVLLLWAALLIVAAIYMGALDHLGDAATGWRRLWKGTGLVMMVYGVLLMVGAASGGDDLFQPLRGVGLLSGGGKAGEEVKFKRVKGVNELQKELDAAVVRGQPVMLDYYADWCISCKELEKYTFSDPGVREVLAPALLLQTDVTANDEEDQAMLKRFGLFGPPAVLFFGPDGRERRGYRVIGFMRAKRFKVHAQQALS